MISELLRPYQRWCETQSNTDEIRQITERELGLLDDPAYLVSNVIGKGEFDWDFRCLDEGFLALVRPYLAQQSGVLPLFLSVLESLSANTNQNRQACLLVEFGHFATLINDYYMFHPDLTAKGIAPRRVSRLTQLRYAGQYLSMYPRHLLVSDRFSLSDKQQVDLHEALAGSVVVQGASRGVILKWSAFAEMPQSRQMYLQNCINTIHSYVVFPIVLAAILAGVDRKSAATLRRSLAYLALAIKLAIECNSLKIAGSAEERGTPRSTASILAFPGLSALSSSRESSSDTYDALINDCLGQFSQQLKHQGPLMSWGENLASALTVEVGG